jgi:hypothetical protein
MPTSAAGVPWCGRIRQDLASFGNGWHGFAFELGFPFGEQF